MSQENVELVTRAIRAATARPKPDFATVKALFHPAHVLVPSAFDLDEVRGARGYQAFAREQAQAGLSATPAEAPISREADLDGAVDVSSDKVLCVFSARYRGSASGVQVSQRQWAVATVRDGQVFRTEIYSDPAEALAAVGENVEVVRLALEAWNRGDVEAFIGSYADDAEIETDPRFIDGGKFRGLPAIRRWAEGVREGWGRGGSVVTNSELIDLGDERVLSLGEWSVTGQASGVQTSIPLAGVWTMRDGTITHVQWFFDRQEALEAVGLRE